MPSVLFWLSRFRNQHDDDGDAGDERAEPVDECALQPMRTAILSASA